VNGGPTFPMNKPGFPFVDKKMQTGPTQPNTLSSPNRRTSPPTSTPMSNPLPSNQYSEGNPANNGQQKHYKINDLKPSMSDFSIMFIVLEKRDTIKTKDQQYITSYIVADETASITLSLWNHKADYINPGDIIRITGAQTQLWQKNTIILTTHARNATITRLGEFTMIFNEKNISALEWEENPPGSKKWFVKSPPTQPSSATNPPSGTSPVNQPRRPFV